MGGKSGARAITIMNESVKFGISQMPWLGKMMDRFTFRAEKMFTSASKNAGRFQKVLTVSTDEWPQRFEEGGKSLGLFAQGLLGVLRAAEPFTEWMSKGLLGGMERFEKWSNGSKGQMAMRLFFNDMKPILKEVGGLVWDFGGAIIDLAQRDKGDIVYFLKEIRGIVRDIPGFVDKWTDRFRKMWPTIESVLEDMSGLLDTIYTGTKQIFDFFDRAKDGANN